MIVTRNRPAETRRAVESCLAQTAAVEVLVYDDASEEPVAEALAGLDVTVTRMDDRVGYIPLRNRGAREAGADVVFSLDDDAYFADADTVRRTLAVLGDRPGAFAAAVPFVERPRPGLAAGGVGRGPGTPVRNFIGCAHAVRREEFLAAGGYRELLVHQTEERDLCLRMLGRGRGVVVGAGLVAHDYSPTRETGRLNFYGVRNTVLVTFLNAPLWAAMPRMAVDSLQLLRYRFEWRAVPGRVRALAAGWVGCLRYAGGRAAVPAAAYRRFRSLPPHGPVLVEALPAPCGRAGGAAVG